MKRRRTALAGMVAAVALATTGCPGNFRHSYGGFTSALEW